MHCKITGCEQPMYRRRLCSGHYKRDRRGQDVNVPLREYAGDGLQPREAILRESTRLADAESEQEYKLRERLLLRYATEYVANKLGFKSFREARAYLATTSAMRAHNSDKQARRKEQAAFSL